MIYRQNPVPTLRQSQRVAHVDSGDTPLVIEHLFVNISRREYRFWTKFIFWVAGRRGETEKRITPTATAATITIRRKYRGALLAAYCTVIGTKLPVSSCAGTLELGFEYRAVIGRRIERQRTEGDPLHHLKLGCARFCEGAVPGSVWGYFGATEIGRCQRQRAE